MRFEIDEAASMEAAAIIEVTKNRVPSTPSSRSNFVLKNLVTQELWDVNMRSYISVRLVEYLQRYKP